MIDQDALKRDAAACIADYPVRIRHYYNAVNYTELDAGLNPLDDSNLLEPAGLLDNPRLSIIAIADLFVVLPKSRDRVDIQLSDYFWKQFEVKNVPDYYDISPTIQFTVGTPDA